MTTAGGIAKTRETGASDSAARHPRPTRGLGPLDPLARPASAFLAELPWEGPVLDPDGLEAAVFLARL